MSSSLQRRRLSNSSSAIGSLPFELLAVILEYAAASFSGHRAVNHSLLPALLGSCSLIRTVALQTPFLWSFVEIRYRATKPEGSESELAHRCWEEELSEHLRRSGNCAFWLKWEIACDLRWMAELRRAVRVIQGVLLPHMLRCYKIEAKEDEVYTAGAVQSTLSPSFFPLEGEMPLLKSISYSGPYGIPSTLLGATFRGSSLRAIRCHRGILLSEDSETEGHHQPYELAISMIDYHDSTHTHLQQFVARAGQESLRFMRIPYNTMHDHEIGGVVGKLELPSLEVLSLFPAPRRLASRRAVSVNLPFIIAPKLAHLKLSPRDHNDESDILNRLFVEGLITFELEGLPVHTAPGASQNPPLTMFLMAQRDLQVLSLPINPMSLRNISGLSAALEINFDLREHGPLWFIHEHLRVLHLHTTEATEGAFLEFFPPLVHMLQERRAVRVIMSNHRVDSWGSTFRFAVEAVKERWSWVDDRGDIFEPFFAIDT